MTSIFKEPYGSEVMGYGGLGLYQKFVRPFVKYKPDKYWLKRGKVYQKRFQRVEATEKQEKKLIDFLNQLTFETVLEFGCGFGRISKLLLDNFPIKEYYAFDLSPHQINNARKLCKKFPNISFEVNKIQDFKSDKKFDLVIGAEVLMHVLPTEIDNVVNKLAGFAKYHIVNIDWYVDILTQKLIPNPHNFLFQYKEIYEKIPSVKSVERIPFTDNGSIFHAIMK